MVQLINFFFILIYMYLFVSPVEVLATAGGEEMEEGGDGLSVWSSRRK